MSNLLKAEFYKLFHSWYFWGIGLFNLLLSSVLLLDSVGETSNLFFASIYNMPILYFLTIIFSALFVGNDFGRRTLQSYINAGHRRGKILFAKLVVHQIACMVMVLNITEHSISVLGHPISFTRQEFKILELLITNPKRVFSKKEIYDYAWDDLYIGEDRTINVHVSNIRQKIKAFSDKEYIETVWGVGFKLAD